MSDRQGFFKRQGCLSNMRISAWSLLNNNTKAKECRAKECPSITPSFFNSFATAVIGKGVVWERMNHEWTRIHTNVRSSHD